MCYKNAMFSHDLPKRNLSQPSWLHLPSSGDSTCAIISEEEEGYLLYFLLSVIFIIVLVLLEFILPFTKTEF